MKDLINNSPFLPQKEKKEEKAEKINTEINNNDDKYDKYNLQKKYSDFNLASEYFNLNDESKNKILDDNSLFSSIELEEDDETFRFYNVVKTNTINFKTPIKINNPNKTKKKEQLQKNKTKEEILKEVSSLSNSDIDIDIDDKKVIISELDIELSNNSKNSDKNFLMSYKAEKNNINMIKKRQNDFKEQIEQNLKKFLKCNQESNKENNIKNKNGVNNNNNLNNFNGNKEIKNDKNNIKVKKRLKKHTQNINYCITDINHKIIKMKKSNNSKNNIKNNSNQLLAITSTKKSKVALNNNGINNNQLKTKGSNVTKKFFNKKLNEFIKINLAKKTRKMTEKNEYKNKLFYLQNKRFNERMIRPYDFSDFIITQRHINNSNLNNNFRNSTEKIRKDFFSASERKRALDKKEKIKYNTSTKKDNANINEKNIIIQNFNCIDYNNINININNNNTMKAHKLLHRRNIEKNNISGTNTQKSYNTIINRKIFNKKEHIYEINSFYKSYIKNFYKNDPHFMNEKVFKFQRKKSDKKLTFVKNNLDIKAKILNYTNNKKQISKLNVKNRNQNKLKNKLNIKTNDIELKKYFNTIEANALALSKQKTLKKSIKNNFVKLLMVKK